MRLSPEDARGPGEKTLLVTNTLARIPSAPPGSPIDNFGSQKVFMRYRWISLIVGIA